MNRLKQKYNEIIAPKILKEFKYGNVMNVPRIEKVVINAGVGPFREQREAVESFVADLTALAGQKPSPRAASTPFPFGGIARRLARRGVCGRSATPETPPL